MSYTNLSAKQLIQRLERADRYPHPDLIRAIWEREVETRPLLLTMFEEAFQDDWPNDEDPRWYRFVHAARFMLGWREEKSLPLFTHLYMDEEMQDWLEWFEITPAAFGPAALPHFAEVIQMDTKGEWHYGQALSASIVAKIGVGYPEMREDAAALLHAKLPPLEKIPQLTEADYDEMWSSFVGDLADLDDEESKEQILALFAVDMIDPMFNSRESYLQELKTPAKVEPEYDLLAIYKTWYAFGQREQQQKTANKQRQVELPEPQTDQSGKIGRNDPCPCGSGKKYKRCHGAPGAR